MEQLEFDLWTEERFSEYDLMTSDLAHSRYAELMYSTFVNRQEGVVLQNPSTMETIVRYRV